MKDRESQSSTETKPKRKRKPKLRERIGARVKSIGQVGRDAVNDPKGIPERSGNWFRRWLGKLWRVRGGGLYAVGYIVCFIFFEIRMFIGEVAESTGVGDFFRSQISEFLFRFFTETIANMVKAFIWPVYVISIHAVYGGIALGLAFWLFPIYLKKPIERWLLREDESPAE